MEVFLLCLRLWKTQILRRINKLVIKNQKSKVIAKMTEDALIPKNMVTIMVNKTADYNRCSIFMHCWINFIGFFTDNCTCMQYGTTWTIDVAAAQHNICMCNILCVHVVCLWVFVCVKFYSSNWILEIKDYSNIIHVGLCVSIL